MSMMTKPPAFIDAFLSLPVPLLALSVMAVWATVAVLVHRVLVPRIAGPDGRRIGKFEAEVASQLGLVLGLLLSFNAVTVWEQSGAARDATLAEASALREVHELTAELPAEEAAVTRSRLKSYLDYVIVEEWPELGRGAPGLDKPAMLRELARLARASGNQDLHDAVASAVSARDDRIRIATSRMLPARWGIVIVLGALALLSVGLIHAENRRARAIAVGMVAFAIGACFVVLMVQARPFLGALALKPTELDTLARALDARGASPTDRLAGVPRESRD
jgi:hypothetical protein